MNSLDMILKMAGLNPDDVKQQIMGAGQLLDRFTAQLNRIDQKLDLIASHNGIIIPDNLKYQEANSHDSTGRNTEASKQIEGRNPGAD